MLYIIRVLGFHGYNIYIYMLAIFKMDFYVYLMASGHLEFVPQSPVHRCLLSAQFKVPEPPRTSWPYCSEGFKEICQLGACCAESWVSFPSFFDGRSETVHSRLRNEAELVLALSGKCISFIARFSTVEPLYKLWNFWQISYR